MNIFLRWVLLAVSFKMGSFISGRQAFALAINHLCASVATLVKPETVKWSASLHNARLQHCQLIALLAVLPCLELIVLNRYVYPIATATGGT